MKLFLEKVSGQQQQYGRLLHVFYQEFLKYLAETSTQIKQEIEQLVSLDNVFSFCFVVFL